ncbi:BofC C-terminal domain-containing protein [Caldalkalibacillus mannanilyticus]|uniref:BofC C-terminal domain-containing protein n=1 Tax=Caldalkalibacillus mannanilyticus TaxID=1418 RepID=UPI0011DC767D|nr:BofC C-terminal domain-containing protein [Caldalkalibacillus mannanilyticus]
MSSLLKKLKRILRRYRGLALLGSIFLLVSSFIMLQMVVEHRKDQIILHHDESLDVLAKNPTKLLLKTKYLCGTETEVKEFKNVKELEAWIDKQNEEWKVSAKNDDEITLSRDVVNDLSPLCKNEGYFGMSEDGVLTLFQGPPMDNQVIQTFFRIDTELLESKLPKEEVTFLRNGIKIHNVAEYLSVLSTFGEFAVEY